MSELLWPNVNYTESHSSMWMSINLLIGELAYQNETQCVFPRELSQDVDKAGDEREISLGWSGMAESCSMCHFSQGHRRSLEIPYTWSRKSDCSSASLGREKSRSCNVSQPVKVTQHFTEKRSPWILIGRHEWGLGRMTTTAPRFELIKEIVIGGSKLCGGLRPNKCWELQIVKWPINCIGNTSR